MALAGFTKSCSKNIAGNSTLYFTEASNISSITVVDDEVTVITMNTGEVFYEYEADTDSIIRMEEGTGTRSNISYTHTIEAKFQKNSADLRTMRSAISDASPCGIVAIVAGADGVKWLVGFNEIELGERALYLATDSFTSGATPAEEGGNVVSVTLQTISGYTALPLDSLVSVPV